MAKLGGPDSIITPEIIKKLADEIADGLPFQYACDYCEVSRVTFEYWLRQGSVDDENDVDSDKRKFFKAIKKAYSSFIRESKRIIRAGASGWQGTAWWLERTNKDFQMNVAELNVPENITINTKMKTRGNPDGKKQ